MTFKLRNFGKIAEADIKLDGITVICGNNNTGKSTVGKALFSFFNSLVDYNEKIALQKANAIMRCIFNSYNRFSIRYLEKDDPMNFVSSHSGDYTVDEVREYLKTRFNVNATKETLISLVESLNISESDILNEYLFRFFDNVMNGQIKKIDSGKARCTVTAEFRGEKNEVTLGKRSCICHIKTPIEHAAYYINSPFVLDWLNNPDRRLVFRDMNPMDRSTVSAIIKAQADINEDSMSNILDSVANKKDLDEVRKVLHQAYRGDTKITNGKYYYCEDGLEFDFRNISAGLKSFALIERMLETGVLKQKDILILDEPEIHLHSEWQIIYAELIVILQKKFDLTILIVTHSFQFLESLNFFMKKYEISDRGNYYIPKVTKNGIVLAESDNNLSEMKKNLKSGAYRLADMQLEFLDSGDDNEDNNE